MASRSTTTLAFLLALNLLFFTFTAADPCAPKPKPKHKHKPKPHPTPVTPPPVTPPPVYGKCPIDTLKLAACANVLNGLISAVIGHPAREGCCTLIGGLVDLDAAVCLCTAIKANILGINLNVPISLSLLVNYCGKKVPKGFQCP